MTTSQNPTACPATGRTAEWCIDQTHVACYAGHVESVALDRKVEAQLAELDEAQIAADAAAFSARLESLTSRREVALRDAQDEFDTRGLPRGLTDVRYL